MSVSDSKTRFSDRVADYAKHRPTYPPAVLAILRESIGLTPDWTVADVGSGTGISAELFLANGNTVYAVEPNGDMRRAAELLLGRWARFHSVDGSAEATGLATGTVDLVVAAQAYHWFDKPPFAAECRRITQAGGWFAAMWNQRATSSAFQDEYDALLHRYCPDYSQTRAKWAHTADDFAAVFGTRFELATTPNHQRFDFAGLKGRLMSSSYAPKDNHPNHEPLIAALRALFDRRQQAGHVRVDYTTEVFYGTVHEGKTD